MASKRQNDFKAQENSDANPDQRRLARHSTSGVLGSSIYPLGLLRRFANEIDDLFGDFAGGRSSVWNRPGLYSTSFEAGWPQIDMFESNGEIIIRADVPGLNKDDLHVEVADDVLTISGERKDEREEQKGEFYRTERSYGRFERRIALPEGANADDITCTFNNGILEIRTRVPKQQNTRSRRLEIQEKGSSDKPERAA